MSTTAPPPTTAPVGGRGTAPAPSSADAQTAAGNRAGKRTGSPGGAKKRSKSRKPTVSSSSARAARARRLWSLVPVAALAAVSGLAYHRVFGMREVLPVVGLAATVPVLLVLLWSRPTDKHKPRPLVGSLAVSALAWSVAVSATLYRDDALAHALPTPDLLRRAGSDVLDAPRGILTTVLPAPGDAALLVLVSAGVWIAAFVGAELALRGTSSALPAVPGLLMLAVPVVLSTGAPGSNTAVLAGAVGAAGLLLVCRAPGRRSPGRMLAVGVPWVAVLAVLAGVVAPQMPGVGAPPDLRDKVSPPPPVRLASVNPLDRISAWLLTPDQPLFRVLGPAEPDRYWRLTVLDRYDGVTWYPVNGLRPTGGRVPEASDEDAKAAHSVQQITLDKLDGVWLPAADRPTRVDVPGDVDLAVDPDSGALATDAQLTPGMHYKVESSVPEYDPDRIQELPTVYDTANTALPEVDAAAEPIESIQEFRRLAIEATAGATFPYQQALRLANWLREKHRYDVTAVPGHSYRNLRFFLESSKEGTSEQFAAAFAVLARSIGLPTRVVVGFSRGTAEPDGSWRVDSGDVVAWPEVEFAEVGWVPFFPTPGEAGRTGAPKNDPADATPGGQVPPPAVNPPAPAEPSRTEKDADIADQVRPGASGPVPSTGGSGTPLWWWAVPLAVLFAAAGGQLGLAAVAPGIVRRRRRHGPPDMRLFGAWRQIGDRLAEIGMPAGGALTVREVAEYGEAKLPAEVGERLWPLAKLVNDTAYAGHAPLAEEADEAWRTCTEVEQAVSRSAERPGLRTRMRNRLAPRQLVASLRRETRG
ncbi:DUF3488 and transglutaminase-like domain-containing protein [Streptodolium elevatio]